MQRRLVIIIFGLLPCLTAFGAPRHFAIDGAAGSQLAQFDSHAPLESFVGRTAEVTGTITADPDNLTQNPQAAFDVQLTGLKTGNRLRDKHMREEFLETDNYPVATFRLTRIVSVDKKNVRPGDAVKMEVLGRLKIHGVEKEIPAEIAADYSGDAVKLSAHFSIQLADFNIERPQFLMMKLDETIRVTLEAVGKS